jgi:hypothetical protein
MKYTLQANAKEVSKVLSKLQSASVAKIPDALGVLLPLCALLLWSISLKDVNIRQMNDLGLVSVMRPLTVTALVILLISFCLALRQPRAPIMLLHVVLLIFMLYGVTALVEEAPRFSVVYRHAGYTEYIMRTGTIAPDLDAYFNWPGFFALAAFVTQVAGYHSILSYAAWAPVFLNLIYLGPLYIIFTTVTTDRRLVWLALWFFYLTNWIGQDYFSPQGFNFFLYLVIIAILLKYFKVSSLPHKTTRRSLTSFFRTGKESSSGGTKGTEDDHKGALNIPATAPVLTELDRGRGAEDDHEGPLNIPATALVLTELDPFSSGLRGIGIPLRFSRVVQGFNQWLSAPDTLRTQVRPGQRVALLVSLVLIFALDVFSHPLTPFFVLASVTALVIFRRCTPRWLPILMAAMTGAWIIIVAQPFLSGHLDWVTGGFGRIIAAFTSNVSSRVVGSPEHTFIAQMRIIMTLFIWGLALLGGILRLRRGYHDITYVLLAIAPFPLLAAQPYGGEMLLRIYLFSLPPMVFFAAALFYAKPANRTSLWMTAAIAGISIVLLGGFLFTRYGNERMDYMTNAEVDGVSYLYNIAQPNSIFIEGWDGTPWQFRDYEKYNTYSMIDTLSNAVATKDVNAIVRFIEGKKHSKAYLIFTRSQKATADATSGMPPGTLDRLETALLVSGKFKLVYSNPDAQIMVFVEGVK